MKPTIAASLLLNLALAGGLIFFVLAHPDRFAEPPSALAPASGPETSIAATDASLKLAPTLWRGLESTNNYRQYVANLRAAGCPEATIEDIVNGDTRRAFAFKRKQLRLTENGAGPWSNQQEQQLVAALLSQTTNGLPPAANEAPNPDEIPAAATQPARLVPTYSPETALGKQTLPVQNSTPPVYPLAFREVNPAALSFSPTQQAAIAQVRQQFIQELGNTSQNPNDPAYLAQWQSAQINADNTLRGLLGNQAYMAYQQQQYYSWFQPKILATASSGNSLEINPADFSRTP